jgi:hypothetical protein
VRFFDFFVSEDHYHIVMELCEVGKGRVSGDPSHIICVFLTFFIHTRCMQGGELFDRIVTKVRRA